MAIIDSTFFDYTRKRLNYPMCLVYHKTPPAQQTVNSVLGIVSETETSFEAECIFSPATLLTESDSTGRTLQVRAIDVLVKLKSGQNISQKDYIELLDGSGMKHEIRSITLDEPYVKLMVV